MLKKVFSTFPVILTLLVHTSFYAQTPKELVEIMRVMDSIEQSFNWQTGRVDLAGDVAYVDVPQGMRYLGAEQSKMVLTDFWGNPPELHTNGMLFPATVSPLSDSAWAFNINFDDMGYVKDEDADEIDYKELLTQMQKEAQEASTERKKQGYEAIEIVGWASPPYYDKSKKVLHWAKEIKFGDATNGNTLNYDVRFLGRNGVLSLNAIGQVSQLEIIKSNIPVLTNSIQFKEGQRYADFDSKIDNVAAWTIGGLVAGKVLAKAGFFALILKFIKPLLLGVVALFAVIRKFITGKSNEE